MRIYKASYPIKEINIHLSSDLQNIDINRLCDDLLEGLTAKNYLRLYRSMRTEIEKEFEDIVVMSD